MRLRAAALALTASVALAMSSCAGVEKALNPSATTTTTGDPDAVPASPPGDPSAPPSPTAAPPPPARPPAAPRTTAGASSVPPGQEQDLSSARGNPGSFASTLLRPQASARLVLEILHHPATSPNDATVAHLADVLRSSSQKPVSVATTALAESARASSPEGIRALSDRSGRAQQGGGQAVVRVLFLAGSLDGDGAALGAAVRGDTAVVFVEQVRNASSPLVGAAALEDAVATHELGHLLGLVDLVRKTGRADPEHPGHSRNRGSVMYWAVESDLVTSVLVGPPPRQFDAADLADLDAIRNGS